MKTLVSIAVFAVLTTTAIAEPVTIFISGNRSETPGLGIPAATTVIGADEIAESGASNLYELFKNHNGIQVSDTSSGGGNATIDMRGFGETSQSNVAILINNQKINTTTDATVWNLHTINIENIERIEIIRGSSGVLYGNQAVGGLINIITKASMGNQSTVKQTIGSFNTKETQASIARTQRNTINFGSISMGINAYKKTSDGYRDHNSTDVEKIDLDLTFEKGVDKTHFNLQSLNDHLETPGSLYANEILLNRKQSHSNFDADFTENQTTTLTATHKTKLDSHSNLDTSMRYQKVHRTFLTSYRSGRETIPGHQYKETVEFSPHITSNTSFGLASYGIDLISSSYELSTRFGPDTNDQNIRAAYGQLEYAVTPKLSATYGARYSTVDNHIVRKDSSLVTYGDVKNDDEVFVNSLGLNYTLNPNTNIFIRADENFRFAKIDEQTNTVSGDIGLKNQTGISYELGGKFIKDKFNFDAVISRLELKNEITSTTVNSCWPCVNPGAYFYNEIKNLNLDQTTKDSLLINTKYSPTDFLQLIFGAEFIDANITGGTHSGKKTPGVANKTFSFGATWTPSSNISHSIDSKWIGKQYLTSDFGNESPMLDSYKTFDYNYSHNFKEWSLGFKVENLTNEKYNSSGATSWSGTTAINGYYPAPERNFMLTAKYNFE